MFRKILLCAREQHTFESTELQGEQIQIVHTELYCALLFNNV